MRKQRIYAATAIALFCMTINQLSAIEPIRFGLKAGIQSQSVKASKQEALGVFSADHDFGYQLGLVARISLPMFYLQPELTYANHRFTMDLGTDAATKVKVNNFELPVLVGCKVAFVRLFVAPVFTLSNSTNSRLKSNSTTALSAEMTKSTLGYQAGGGVEFGHINVDMRYGGQFKKAELSVLKGDQSAVYKTKLNQWQINLVYLF